MNEFQRLIRQWRNQIRRGLEEFKGKQATKNTNKRPDIKMCPVCSKFNDAKAPVCAYCDAELMAKPKGDFDAQGNLRPDTLNPVFFVFFLCVSMHALAIFFSSRVEDYNLASEFWSPDNHVLMRMGANMAPFIVYNNEIWRLITYSFLHGSLMHIFFNLSALGYLGPLVFDAFGGKRFWLLTLATGLGGGLLSFLGAFLGIGGFGVGFSGALFGYIGAVFVWARRNRQMTIAETMRRYMIWGNIIFIALTVFRLFPVDNLGHLGGMFSGMGLAWLFNKPGIKQKENLETVILVLCVALAAFGLFQIFSDVNLITQPVTNGDFI